MLHGCQPVLTYASPVFYACLSLSPQAPCERRDDPKSQFIALNLGKSVRHSRHSNKKCFRIIYMHDIKLLTANSSVRLCLKMRATVVKHTNKRLMEDN